MAETVAGSAAVLSVANFICLLNKIRSSQGTPDSFYCRKALKLAICVTGGATGSQRSRSTVVVRNSHDFVFGHIGIG